jgi:septal ring-binding cell division protein DamX
MDRNRREEHKRNWFDPAWEVHQAPPVMTVRILVCALLSIGVVSCGGSQKKPKDGDGKLVPEENQKKSRERLGRQQMMMDDLNMTPAERAAARHDDATRPVENPKYSEEEKKKE